MIQLLPFTPEDFDQLINWIGNEKELIKWSGNLFNYPLNHESLQWYISNTNDPETSDAFVYKAIDSETSKVVGHISLGSISRKNKSGRISRVLIGDQESRGKGYCRQMVEAVSNLGFGVLQLHRISLGVYTANIAAISCYQKAGYSIEGVHRDVLWNDGEWLSIVEMGMLQQEWQVRKRMELSKQS